MQRAPPLAPPAPAEGGGDEVGGEVDMADSATEGGGGCGGCGGGSGIQVEADGDRVGGTSSRCRCRASRPG